MTPAAIIQQATAEGVSLTLSPAGTIKATGDQVTVTRWLPLIRENKPGVVAALQQAANGEALPDSAMEVRRQRVLEVLAAKPSARFAFVTDVTSDPAAVLLTLAIRGLATCELRIPREKYDPFLLLALIDRHSETVH